MLRVCFFGQSYVFVSSHVNICSNVLKFFGTILKFTGKKLQKTKFKGGWCPMVYSYGSWFEAIHAPFFFIFPLEILYN